MAQALIFFAVWKLFEETSTPDQRLDYISVEKYPLTPDFIRDALKPWQSEIGDYVEEFLQHYPIRIHGFHRIKLNKQVTLTLQFDDVEKAFSDLDTSVDCWFLDGFTPAKNPDMWKASLYDNMARLSHDKTSFATFTAAGDVKRGLQEVGFTVQKTDGFGRKRDMMVGCYTKANKAPALLKEPRKNIAIIGGGLAGTACAYTLRQYGFSPVLFESASSLAAGASGNSLGLYNPRFSKLRDDLSNFFAPAYAQFIRMAKQTENKIDYRPCGTLHLFNDHDKTERYKSMAHHWGWHDDHVKILSPEQSNETAGIRVNQEGLFLPDSGSVSPQKLCHYYAHDIDVRFNHNISDEMIEEFLNGEEFDAVILTGGAAMRNSRYLSWLETDIIRGQVSHIKATEQSRHIKCNLSYGGYISPAYDGYHIVGSSFEKGTDCTALNQEEHDGNIDKLEQAIPLIDTKNITISDGWAGIRLSTRDRFPLIGSVPNQKNLYISMAFGSHGLIGSMAGAHLLADMLRKATPSLSRSTMYALSPQRFIDRAARKGRILL